MMTHAGPLLMLAAAWLAYGGVHSLLASRRFKAWLTTGRPNLARRYRLLYNLTALALLAPPLALTLALNRAAPWLWRWQGPWLWVANGLAVAALAAFAWSLRGYDMREFLGLDSGSTADSGTAEPQRLRLSSFHRWVRHPWYFFILVMLWSRDMTPPRLVTVAALTAYLIVGSRLEEKKLVELFGETYRRYRQQVPGLVPLPWRHLSRKQADELQHRSR